MISQNQPEINDRPECYALYVLMSYNAVVSCDSVLSAGLLNKSDFFIHQTDYLFIFTIFAKS